MPASHKVHLDESSSESASPVNTADIAIATIALVTSFSYSLGGPALLPEEPAISVCRIARMCTSSGLEVRTFQQGNSTNMQPVSYTLCTSLL
jgi:hypothetical protein